MIKLNEKLKLFISYSHDDEDYINEFIKHIAPLKNNGLIEDWYDRKLLSGENFLPEIDNNLEDADIICLFLSANFLASQACIKEKKNALKLQKENGVIVIPIILSSCGWLDDNEVSSLLALPTDGKPISEYADKNTGWNIVYEGIKPIINKEIANRKLEITENFYSFLQDTELLSKAHSQKSSIKLDDIFIYPDLSIYNQYREYERKINAKDLVNNIHKYHKILLAGENQSGKTALCKKIYVELRKKNYIPIYISDKAELYYGKIANRISKALTEQYGVTDSTGIDSKKIIILLDDFHFAKNQEKHIQELSEYNQIIVTVDDIYSLNFRNDTLIKSFTYFKIEELSPSLRNELIKKWTHLTDDGVSRTCNNLIYKKIDDSTEFVNVTLGKMFGNGIMPAHPFFILSVISTYEAFSTPLDQEITSQGYCYQALIYMYLRKQGVKNDEVDTYINFLTEFAYFIFSEQKDDLSNDVFSSFMESYLEKFNLPIDQNVLLDKLNKSHIVVHDSFGNYNFYYKYIYYFFVAKYLSENVEKYKEVIDNIINNLHEDKNAYIAIFISHHSNNDYILDELFLNAICLFDKFEPATLKEDELHFFDKQKDIIIKALLPANGSTPEMTRKERLKIQDFAEENMSDDEPKFDDIVEEFAIDLRRSIKTVEVIGRIIKNRAGSLEKPRLESMFQEAMRVHLRLMSHFFKLIEHEDAQQSIIDFISSSINDFIEHQAEERKKEGKIERKPSKEALEKMSKTIFWNLNFFLIYGLINKIVFSIGSHKLTNIIETVCDKEDTPASFLVKHGILMWYNKNIQIETISTKLHEENFSNIARKIMELQIVNHCAMHDINYKDKQRLSNKLKIGLEKLIKQPGKIS